MKAATREKYCGPDDLIIKDLPKPQIEEEELLVRIHFTTVNRTDIGVITGLPKIFRLFAGFPKPKYPVTGTDFSGEIEEVGSKVNNFKVGDRVFGFHDAGIPTHAEYIVLSSKIPFSKIPDNTSFEDAVASLEGAHYAINFLKKLDLNSKKTAFVNGGTGAIGSAMIQMLKNKGVQVDSSSRKGHVERVKELGADRVFDYQNEDFTDQDKMYDYVLDAVGKSSYGQCKKILKNGGVYISSELGPGNENLYLPITTMFSSKKLIFPFPVDVPGSIREMSKLLSEGKFKPLIDKQYKLDNISEAFKYVMSEQKVGNVLIKINEE